jgi:hypothetical protein
MPPRIVPDVLADDFPAVTTDPATAGRKSNVAI